MFTALISVLTKIFNNIAGAFRKKQSDGLKIALGHQARVGKDTFADYVDSTRGCVKLNFAAKVYEIATYIQTTLGRKIEKDPKLLQFIGDGLRNVLGEDIFVNDLIVRMRRELAWNPSANIIITDLRYPNEFSRLHDEGFMLIKITRENRPIDRDPNHKSEIALLNHTFDIHMTNDSTPDDFKIKIDDLLN